MYIYEKHVDVIRVRVHANRRIYIRRKIFSTRTFREHARLRTLVHGHTQTHTDTCSYT